MDRVAQRNEPPAAAHGFVVQNADANRPRHGKAQNQVCGKACGCDRFCRSKKRNKHGPKQSMRENQSEIRERPTEPHSASPAQLVIPETSQRLPWVHRGHYFARKNHFSTSFGDAMTKLVVVG